MLTDTVADMLTRLRNANMALHDTAEMPSSKLRVEIARVLQEEGYITSYEVQDAGVGKTLVVNLKYDKQRRRVISGLKRISRPGKRVYADRTSIPRVIGGMGIAILSTSSGVISGHDAVKRGIGGEVLCSVW
ncbi:MAG: 30S ribosomal protein S8 [Miltoncostaeaceae bacterium]